MEKPVAKKVAAKPAAKKPVAKKPVAKKPVAKKPVAKTPVAKKPVAKKPVAKKPVAKQPVAKKPVAKAAVEVKAPAAPKVKVHKPKLVRDSFTMPDDEYAVLGMVKKACLKAGVEVKKSELLRAGVSLLKQLDLAALKQVLAGLPQLKTGRPKKS
jgi:hypothetical protein